MLPMEASSSRRQFIKGSGSALLSASFIPNVSSLFEPLNDYIQTLGSTDRRTLSFYNIHTGEKNKVTYWVDGKYDDDALSELNTLLRDHRQNEVIDINKNLLDSVYALSQKMDYKGPINVISCYRSPKTNKMLRKKSKGVAKRSFHMVGKAIDISIDGHRLRDLRNTLLKMKMGGVGYYPKSGFVHMDIGRVRSWG